MTGGRFPAPWTIEDDNNACFIVRDKNGHRSPTFTMKKSRDDGLRPISWPRTRRGRVALNIAKLELPHKP